MSVEYSLRVRPNWAPAYSPAWQEMDFDLDTTALPSMSIGAERADIPLTMVASDLSLTVSNSKNEWDAIFDTSKIVGALPPSAGAALRVPLPSLGEVLFCRKSELNNQWEVVFYGFINPISVRFGRSNKTCTFTAYSCAKLLENGNAERVNKVSKYAPAPPFVIQNGSSFLVHPVAPPGSGSVEADNTWWQLNGIQDIPFVSGDQFNAVRPIPVWQENIPLDAISNDTYTIKTVVVSAGSTFLQTVEAPNLNIGFGSGLLELLTPWFRGKTWEALVQALVAEVNQALMAAGVDTNIAADTFTLPLLPATDQLFAQLIDMADVDPTVNGVSYSLYGGTRRLIISTQLDTQHAKAEGKRDILGPVDLGPVTVGPFNPTPIAGYIPGPENNLALRLLSANCDLGIDAKDFDANDLNVQFSGQDIHSFSVSPGVPYINNQRFDSVKFCRSPSSYKTGATPKNYYRIYAHGRYINTKLSESIKVGIEIARLTTPDSGATWTIQSAGNALVTIPLNLAGNPNPDFPGVLFPPDTGPSTQVDIKVFQLAAGSFLYCWTNPFLGEAYVKHSTIDTEEATFFFPPPASFIIPGTFNVHVPKDGSGFVTEGQGGNVWFFCDQADGTGVVLYYWNGSAMTGGSINNGGPSLVGGDFINAIVDTQGGRHRFYVMAGKTLFVWTYSFVGGVLNFIGRYQGISIDQVNYDQAAEQDLSVVSRPGALAWLTGPVLQANSGEPNYTAASDSLILGSIYAIYIVSNVAANIVDYADFSGLSVAGALALLIVVRGYQMLTGADQHFVPDPAFYTPLPLISFRQRIAVAPSVIDLSDLTEGCDDGLWLQNYVAVGVQNSKVDPVKGPFFNGPILTALDGTTFTINPPRNPTSAALIIDNPFLGTSSFMKLLANIYAQEFLVPQPDATVILADPYVVGSNLALRILDVIKYLKRSADDADSVPLFGQGRILSIDYGFDNDELTVKVG